MKIPKEIDKILKEMLLLEIETEIVFTKDGKKYGFNYKNEK